MEIIWNMQSRGLNLLLIQLPWHPEQARGHCFYSVLLVEMQWLPNACFQNEFAAKAFREHSLPLYLLFHWN